VSGLVRRGLVRFLGWAYVAYAAIVMAMPLARATTWTVRRWWDVVLLPVFVVAWPVVFPGSLAAGAAHGGGRLWDPFPAALTVLMLAWALIGWSVALAALARRLRSHSHRAASSPTKGESPR
jgi:hypothetical protein